MVWVYNSPLTLKATQQPLQLDGAASMIHEGGEQSLASTAKVEKFHPNRHPRRDLRPTELNSRECSTDWKFFISSKLITFQ